MQALLNLADQGFGRCLIQAISAIGRDSTPHPERKGSDRMNDYEANDDG